MAAIVEVKSGKYTYLYYQFEMKRDENGMPRGKRKCVGKIDPKNGARVFKEDFLQEMRKAGTPIEEDKTIPKFSVADIENAIVQEYGLMDLLNKTAENYGLKGALQKASPNHADEIFVLASHLVASGDPFMHTQDWLENTDVPNSIGNMSSQKISRILSEITVGERNAFYREWTRTRSEMEYLAIDITSTSSYSELINSVEWGYNRDSENLPQVNLCLLMGETSRLPIYQTSYCGSLKDVSTLKHTLREFDIITEGKPICAVTDKGFYSKSNIDLLLEEKLKFAVAVPFSNKFADKQIDDFNGKIDDFSHTIIVGKDTLRAVTQKRKWGDKYVWTHIYFNPKKQIEAREKRFQEVLTMLEKAKTKPEKFINDKKYLRCFNFQKTEGNWEVTVNEDDVEASCKNSGWLIIISNHIKNATEMLKIYRAKDVVEKGFLKLKNSLDVGRLRVHSDTAMHSKLLIGFVALIMMSFIHIAMCDNNLYKKWTMKELLRIIAKRKVHKICGENIICPMTKLQREIYAAFGLSEM